MLPKEIGPHEGIEFDLMRAGKKNVSMFIDYVPHDLDETIINDNLGKMQLKQYFSGRAYITTIAYHPAFKEWAEELSGIMLLNSSSFDVAKEKRIGELLSYSDIEIDAYISYHLARLK